MATADDAHVIARSVVNAIRAQGHLRGNTAFNIRKMDEGEEV